MSSPSDPLNLRMRHLAAIFFQTAILLPYATLYRLEKGSYFTPEVLKVLPVTFIVSGLCLLACYFLLRKKYRKPVAGLILALCAGFSLWSVKAEAQGRCFDPENCDPFHVEPTPVPPPPSAVPTRPIWGMKIYKVGIISAQDQAVTVFKDGPIAGYWAGSYGRTTRDLYDTQIFSMIDRNGGALISGDTIVISAYKPAENGQYLGGLRAGPNRTMMFDGVPSDFQIMKADGSSGPIGPRDTVYFKLDSGEVMHFVPRALGTRRECTEPNPDSNNHHLNPRCYDREIPGSQLTYGAAASVDQSTWTFQLGWAFNEIAFADRNFWVDEEYLTDHNKFYAYAMARDNGTFDQYLAETIGFEISWGRTWFDAMRASGDGAGLGGAAGTVMGGYFGGPIGAAAGGTLGIVAVGTVNVVVATKMSIETQRAEYAKKQADKNRKEWEAARKREMQPGFVGPPRPEAPPTGFGDEELP